MNSIDSEFVRYIMHVEVKENPQAEDTQDTAPVVEEEATKADPKSATSSGADAKPVQGKAKLAGAGEVVESADGAKAQPTSTPKVNNEFENVGRNAPCPCGSGKKFKHCHGR